jgi:CshA-type fibril repeat protein
LDNDIDVDNDMNRSSVDLNFTTITDATGTDTDGDGDIDQVDVVGEGTWSIDNNGTLTFIPDGSLIGDPQPIYYTVEDNTGLESESVKVYIDYPPYIPISQDDEVTKVLPASPDEPTFIFVLNNDSDLDGDINASSVSLSALSNSNAIEVDTDGDGDIDEITVDGEGVWSVDENGVVKFRSTLLLFISLSTSISLSNILATTVLD